MCSNQRSKRYQAQKQCVAISALSAIRMKRKMTQLTHSKSDLIDVVIKAIILIADYMLKVMLDSYAICNAIDMFKSQRLCN